jgi:uncharacterized SAM-binding protein YcdF (DUF218 family)
MTALRANSWWIWFKRLFLIGFGVWLSLVVALVIAIHITGTLDTAQASDVIIVLGAGLNDDETPGYALTRRSLHAAVLWMDGYARNIICSGGYTGGHQRSEADGCRDILLSQGIPSEAIVLENQSHSTEENAIYSRQFMEANNWSTAILVSDSFHMLRSRIIFQSQGYSVTLSPVRWQDINSIGSYITMLGREIVAYHWHIFKDMLRLRVTSVPFAINTNYLKVK